MPATTALQPCCEWFVGLVHFLSFSASEIVKLSDPFYSGWRVDVSHTAAAIRTNLFKTGRVSCFSFLCAITQLLSRARCKLCMFCCGCRGSVQWRGGGLGHQSHSGSCAGSNWDVSRQPQRTCLSGELTQTAWLTIEPAVVRSAWSVTTGHTLILQTTFFLVDDIRELQCPVMHFFLFFERPKFYLQSSEVLILLSLIIWTRLICFCGVCRRKNKEMTPTSQLCVCVCVCVCARVRVRAGCLGAHAEERTVWGAECQFRRKGAAVDDGLRLGRAGPERCLCFSSAADSWQQQLQGEPRLMDENQTELNWSTTVNY